jgi:hypothetical protein
MTRPFDIWCQRGRDLEQWFVIFRGSSPLCLHLELLHCTCIFNFSHAWTLVGLKYFVRPYGVMWLRTRTCGFLCDGLCLWFQVAYLLACSSSCRVLRLTLAQFYWIYICGCCLDLYFVGETPSKLLYLCICVKIKWKLYAHM